MERWNKNELDKMDEINSFWIQFPYYIISIN